MVIKLHMKYYNASRCSMSSSILQCVPQEWIYFYRRWKYSNVICTVSFKPKSRKIQAFQFQQDQTYLNIDFGEPKYIESPSFSTRSSFTLWLFTQVPNLETSFNFSIGSFLALFWKIVDNEWICVWVLRGYIWKNIMNKER